VTPTWSSFVLQALFTASVSALVAWLLTLTLVRKLADYADRRDWVDAPGGRKRHKHEVPVVGGLAMAAGAIAAVVAFDPRLEAHRAVICSLGALTLLGLYDDRRQLGAGLRLMLQAAVAGGAVMLGGPVLTDLGNLFGTGPLLLGSLATAATIFTVIGVTNAVNLIDGLDGLAGGLVLVALGWFLLILFGIGLRSDSATALQSLALPAAFAGAILGFLRYNLRTRRLSQAEVFMGSAGSLTLGLMLAWMAIDVTQSFGPAAPPPAVALWILAVPLFDTVSCMLRRLQAGQSPARPDRRHIHHLLLARGMRTRLAVARLHTTAMLCGALGVAAWLAGIPEPVLFGAFLLTFFVYHVYACLYWTGIDRARAMTASAETVSGTPAIERGSIE